MKEKQPERLRKRSLTPVCAWCGKVRTESGSWTDIDPSTPKPPAKALTHGVCPECEEKWTLGTITPNGRKPGPRQS